MGGNKPDVSRLEQNSVFQKFARDEDELSRFKQLMKDHPSAVIQKNMLGMYVAGVKTYARISTKTPTYAETYNLLKQYDLIPEQWHSYYPNE